MARQFIVLFHKTLRGKTRRAVRLLKARDEHHAQAKVFARIKLGPGDRAAIDKCIEVLEEAVDGEG